MTEPTYIDELNADLAEFKKGLDADYKADTTHVIDHVVCQRIYDAACAHRNAMSVALVRKPDETPIEGNEIDAPSSDYQA